MRTRPLLNVGVTLATWGQIAGFGTTVASMAVLMAELVSILPIRHSASVRKASREETVNYTTIVPVTLAATWENAPISIWGFIATAQKVTQGSLAMCGIFVKIRNAVDMENALMAIADSTVSVKMVSMARNAKKWTIALMSRVLQLRSV